LPNGLILRLFDMVKQPVATPTGVIYEELPQARPDTIVVKGVAIDIEGALRGRSPEFNAVHGYALTPGVPRDFWEMWLEQNKKAAYVLNKCIFAMSSEARARDKVKSEMSKMLSGLEPIDPENPAAKSPDLRGLGNLRVERADVNELRR